MIPTVRRSIKGKTTTVRKSAVAREGGRENLVEHRGFLGQSAQFYIAL